LTASPTIFCVSFFVAATAAVDTASPTAPASRCVTNEV
jgi:hypothetical protein